jgi:hypothetical protein
MGGEDPVEQLGQKANVADLYEVADGAGISDDNGALNPQALQAFEFLL